MPYTDAKWSALDTLCFVDYTLWEEIFAALRERIDVIMGADVEAGTQPFNTWCVPDRVAGLITLAALPTAPTGVYAIDNGQLGQRTSDGGYLVKNGYPAPGTIVYDVSTDAHFQAVATAGTSVTVNAPGTTYDGTYTLLGNQDTVYVCDAVANRTRQVMGRYTQVSASLWVKVSSSNHANTIIFDGTTWAIKDGATTLYTGTGDTLTGVTWSGLGTYRGTAPPLVSGAARCPVYVHASGYYLLPVWADVTGTYLRSVIVSPTGTYLQVASTIAAILAHSWTPITAKTLPLNTAYDFSAIYNAPNGAHPLYAAMYALSAFVSPGWTTHPCVWADDYSTMSMDNDTVDDWAALCTQTTAYPVLHITDTTYVGSRMVVLPAYGRIANGQYAYGHPATGALSTGVYYDGTHWLLHYLGHLVGQSDTLTGTYTLNTDGVLYFGTASVTYGCNLVEWIGSRTAPSMTCLLGSWESLLSLRTLLSQVNTYICANEIESAALAGWYTKSTSNPTLPFTVTVHSKVCSKLRVYKIIKNSDHSVLHQSASTTNATWTSPSIAAGTSVTVVITYAFDYA